MAVSAMHCGHGRDTHATRMTAHRHRDSLTRFVRAVRRRIIVVRAIEGAGVGIAISAAFALVLACSLLWLGREGFALSAAMLMGGAVIGASWALRKWPAELTAAAEADRQLKLSDLLATAWARRDESDPWQHAVVVMAEARCRTLSPSSVILARFGSRAWSGIGLSAALVLTISSLSMSPRATVATTPGGVRDFLGNSRDNEVAPTSNAGASAQRQTARATASPVNEPSSPRGGDSARPGSNGGAGQSSARTSSSKMEERSVARAKAAESGGPDVGSGAKAQAGGNALTGSPVGSGASQTTVDGSPSPMSTHEPAHAGETRVPNTGTKDQYRDVAKEYFDGR